ncbi:hypothetical protein LCGC14_1375910 [marine sediment metagenome]|uniref:Uncharacterized protein n=1 Tax=marine sediment metagenome TaxID=412755 RepID=A0A0F9MJD1_9ZZZZ
MSISVTRVSTLSIQDDAPSVMYYVIDVWGSLGLQITITYYTILATTSVCYAIIA